MASVASQGASGGGGSSSREAASSARTSGSSSRHLASGGVGSSLAPSVMNSTTNNSKRSSERRSFHACTASPRSNAATNTPISSARVTAGVRARGASPAPSVGMRSGQGSRRSSAHEASAGKRSTSTANQVPCLQVLDRARAQAQASSRVLAATQAKVCKKRLRWGACSVGAFPDHSIQKRHRGHVRPKGCCVWGAHGANMRVK